MTYIEKTDAGPLDATPRQRLTRAERNLILERQANKCDACGETLIWLVLDNGAEVFGPMIDEHILPLDLGGSNDLSNRALYCVPCAKAKTREDMKRILKARRLRRKEAGEDTGKPKMKGRGFRRDPLSWRNA